MGELQHISGIIKRAIAVLVSPAELPGEYIVVLPDDWHDFTYSVEDAEDEGIEYHVCVNSDSDVDEIESILWSIWFLNEYQAEIRRQDVAVGDD